MYQRINDCYVFFIAIYNNHKWALVVPCDTGDIKYLGGNLCGILCVILCGREFTLSRVTSGYSNSLANCGNEVVGKLRWKTMEKHWWKTMETPCQRHGKKRWNIMQHYFGRKPMDTPWWKTFGGKQRKSIGGQQRKTAVGKLQTK